MKRARTSELLHPVGPGRAKRRGGVVLTAVAIIFLAALSWLPGHARAEATEQSPATSKPAPAVTLYDVVTNLARVDGLRRETEASLRDTVDLAPAAKLLDAPALVPIFQSLAESADSVSRVRYLELRDLDAHVHERLNAVGQVVATTGTQAQKFVAQLDRLDREAALWPERSQLAREAQAPAEIQRSIDAVIPALAELRERLVARRDQLLLAYERAVRLKARLDTVRADVAQRRELLWSELRRTVADPIWRQQPAPLALYDLPHYLSLARFDRDWSARHMPRMAAGLLVTMAVVFFALRRRSAAGVDQATSPLPAPIALCAAIVVAMVGIAAFAPSGAPFVFYRLVWLCCPLVAAVVATHTFARSIPASAWTAALAVSLNECRMLAELDPLTDWLLLVLQVVPFVAAVIHDWRRGGLAQAFPHASKHLLRRLIQADVAALVLAVGLAASGYVGLAALPVALGLIAPGFMLTFGALAWGLDRALGGLLSLPLAQTLRSVRSQPESILVTMHRTVLAAAWAGGAAAFALSYSALDDVQRVVTSLAESSVSVGDVTIRLRAVVFALIIIAATWLVAKLVRFMLDNELLPRLGLRAGVPIAVSTIAGYLLVVTGSVLALAALGIDFTKVTLFAGALGIGVGLGLQSVFNNFASGLILMLERPVNVGDQIDVGGVVGEVKRIGVRSSTIRTWQGAEIIVPNADFVTNKVTNWTLSDRARRYEIDVGVAYGNDPKEVLKLLERAAASVPEVQHKPAPLAAFTGFGDSSLNFRLYAWVDSIDVGIQAQNGLRTAILQALSDAGIVIPLSQRDMRTQYMPGTALARQEPVELCSER